jgi:NAD(P)-dependent dehydrogenase (short-subunit alcohol dehydrogenase family)
MGSEASDLPKLAAPARRALAGAGYIRLEDLTKATESEVMQLHGMGRTRCGRSAPPWRSAACPSAKDDRTGDAGAGIDRAHLQVMVETGGYGLDVLVNAAGILVLGPVEAVSGQQTRAQRPARPGRRASPPQVAGLR